MQEKQLLEDEDDLGYYHNGVKRTLTDEQIAMFRHSEIYAIVRQRQLQKENQEDEPKNEAINSIPGGPESTGAEEQDAGLIEVTLDVADAILPLTSPVRELANSDDDEEYIRFLEAEEEEMRTEAVRKKRKRNGRYPGGNHDRAPTHRRLVRELDEVGFDSGDLDYGEEPVVSVGPTQTKTLQPSLGRKPIVCDEEENGGPPIEASNSPHARQVMPQQGRKIWWPTIGT